jgi:hypothetical protein
MFDDPYPIAAMGSEYDQLYARLVVLLDGFGKLTVSNLDQWEERIAVAVYETTGMTPERWDRLDCMSRVPWMEKCIHSLRREQATESLDTQPMDPDSSEPPAAVTVVMPSAARESAGNTDSGETPKPQAYPVHIESVSDEVAQLLGARKPPESASIPPGWSGTAWDSLTPLLKRLLNYMYAKEQADITDLETDVWGKHISDAALQTALSKANNFLLTIRHTRTLAKVRGEPVVRWQ